MVPVRNPVTRPDVRGFRLQVHTSRPQSNHNVFFSRLRKVKSGRDSTGRESKFRRLQSCHDRAPIFAPSSKSENFTTLSLVIVSGTSKINHGRMAPPFGRPIRLVLIVPFRGFILADLIIINFIDHSVANERTFSLGAHRPSQLWPRIPPPRGKVLPIPGLGPLAGRALFGARAEIGNIAVTGVYVSRHLRWSAMQLLAL